VRLHGLITDGEVIPQAGIQHPVLSYLCSDHDVELFAYWIFNRYQEMSEFYREFPEP